MPSNKKHHFVPKFYLKHFSMNEKSINLYNIARNRIAIGGNLRNQCYKDYFYGKDSTIEKGLSVIEGAAAEILRAVIEFVDVPPRMTPHHLSLLSFVVIQHTRTSYAIDSLNEIANKLAKHILRPKGVLTQEAIDAVTISLTEAGAYSVSLAATQWPIACDLHYKLLTAKDGQQFITSDNPVVYYNQVFEAIDKKSNAIGLACKGLQIFFPISPSKGNPPFFNQLKK